jgi:CBS domain-containing protein
MEARMKVKDVMAPDVETVRPNQSVKEIAQRMARQAIGYFPVCERNRLLGIVTDRDITCRAVADGRDPMATKVREVMSKAVAYCFDDDDLAAAIHLMEQNRIRRIPVLDHGERLVGILSLTDIAQRAPRRLTAELVEAVSRETPLSVTINPAADILE